MTSLNGTMVPIETVEVGAGGQAAIEFTNIPQTYTDLVVKLSTRTNESQVFGAVTMDLNGSTSSQSTRYLYGSGASAGSLNPGSVLYVGDGVGANATASTFSNMEVYIPNYTSSNNKSASADAVAENNATTAYSSFTAMLWSNTAAITSIRFNAITSKTFQQYSTATLYGVKNYALTQIDDGAKASGGIVTSDANYWYHTFTSSGTFTPTQSLTADILVVAGGGGGFNDSGTGGAGAGGLLGFTGQSLTSQNYTVTVGAGGASGTNGGNSQFGALTASVGGGSSNARGVAGSSGGSGGGGSSTSAGTGATVAGGAGTAGQGNAGGSGQHVSNVGEPGGGGGGAGAAGENGAAGNATLNGDGGNGVSTYSSWGLATDTGENISGTYWYAGGGPGFYSAVGGLGGGGTTSSGGRTGTRNGLAKTGGGGGNSAVGGSGVIIVRYAK